MPKKHTPTDIQRGQVEGMAACGVPHKDIASYVGVSENTLEKWYKDELSNGRSRGNIEVRHFLFNAATGKVLNKKLKSYNDKATFKDCLTAAIFWGKTQMGMSDKAQETDATEKIANAIASLVDKLPS
jgi:hypothetical protein